jgi:hypothetical protein
MLYRRNGERLGSREGKESGEWAGINRTEDWGKRRRNKKRQVKEIKNGGGKSRKRRNEKKKAQDGEEEREWRENEKERSTRCRGGKSKIRRT